MNDHWSKHLALWQNLGSPLRPNPQDLSTFQRYIDQAHRFYRGPLNVLVLSVTPELTALDWPNNSYIVAKDQSKEMISGLWRHRARQAAILANWRVLPISSQSIHLILGDDCFTTFASPELYTATSRELHRVLHPQGFFAHRFFLKKEDTHRYLKHHAFASQSNFHAFKLSLAMALQTNFNQGVLLNNVWREFATGQYTNPNWSQQSVSTMENHRGSKSRYTFPSMSQLQNLMHEFFDTVCVTHSRYTFADHCLAILYQKRQL